MKRKIVVHTNTKNDWGGSYQYARAILKSLTLLGKNAFEVCLWHTEDVAWTELASNLGFEQRIFSENQASKFITTQYGTLIPCVPSELIAYQPDIIIFPQMGGLYYCPGAIHIGVIHDLMHRYESRFPEVGAPEEIARREELFTNIISCCDAILVDSPIGEKHVRECYKMARGASIHVLPFAPFDDIESCPPIAPEFSHPSKFLFYPAQFWLHKNHIGLARAVALLRKELPEMHIIATGGIDKNGFLPFIEEATRLDVLDAFTLPGYVPTECIAWLYKNAKGFIMPSFFGPTNIPPLEAMALGCPVAISDVYAARMQCGDAALYFNPGDPDDLSQAMRTLWSDTALCEHLKQQGVKKQALYNIETFQKRCTKIVQSILLEQSTQSNNTTTQNITQNIPESVSEDSQLHFSTVETASRPLRIQQADEFYGAYLEQFYNKRPRLAQSSYKEQTKTLFDDGFSAVHAVVPYLANLGCITDYFIYNCRPAQYAWARETGTPLPHPGSRWEEEALRQRIDWFKPDVLYIADPIRFDAHFLNTLRFRPSRVVSWRGADIPFGTDWTGYDIMLSGLPRLLKLAESLGAKKGIQFNPGMPTWIARAVEDIPQDTDVVFVGSINPQQHIHRLALLKTLAQAATKHNFSLALHLLCDPALIPAILHPFMRPPVFGLEMHKALRRGRIVVDDRANHGLVMPDGSKKLDLGGEDTINMRMFEATGGGSLLLTEALAGVARYFEPGKEVVTYTSFTHAVEHISYYLQNNNARERLAQAGKKRCLDEWNMNTTAKKFLEIIKQSIS